MKTLLPLLAAAALLPLSLTGCGPSPYEQEVQLLRSDETRLSASIRHEALELLRHYARTGDARYATPQHHITMLHLAALCCDEVLVKELLAKGAEPDALMLPLEKDGPQATPLSFMFSAHRIDTPAEEELLRVAGLLRQAGASLAPEHCTPLLTACGWTYNVMDFGKGVQEGDAVARQLMEWGAPAGMEEAREFLSDHWFQSLLFLLPRLSEAERAELRADEYLWNHCAAAPFDHAEYGLHIRPGSEPHALALAAAVLEGAELGAEPEHPARQAFRRVALGLAREDVQAAAFDRTRHADFLALLLAHGADAYEALGSFGKSCAADAMAAHPAIRARFEERGLSSLLPEPPAHELREAELVEQLMDIPTPAIRTEEAQRHFGLLARLIAEPTPAQLEEPLLQRQACVRALALMARADLPRTQAWLMEQPAWRDAAAWEGDATAARGLLYALQMNKQPLLPAGFLAEAARGMHAAGRPGLAHAFARLLEGDRGAEAEAQLAAFAQAKDAPALRAAALTCRLHRAGLPSLETMFSENKWPYEYCVHLAVMAAESACCVSRVAALEQPERLFYTGSMPCCRDATHEALVTLGAPLAAAWYATGTGDPAAAGLELECVVAEHILRYAEHFRHPRRSIDFNHLERLFDARGIIIPPSPAKPHR